MKILYFSWVREKIGMESEYLKINNEINDINELISFLKTCSENHNKAFSDLNSINVAINKSHASHKSKIKDSDEVAFFPPITGG